MPREIMIENLKTGERRYGSPDWEIPQGWRQVETPAPESPVAEEMPWSEVAMDLARKTAGVVGRAALPTLGGVGGGLAGAPLAPFTGGASVPIGTALGSVAGLKANELLGIESPTAGDYALTAAMPLAISGARNIVTRLPGSEAGRQAVAMEKAVTIPGLVAPGIESNVLFQQLRGMNARIPTTRLADALKAARELEGHQPKAWKDPDIRKAITGLEQILHPAPGIRARALDIDTALAQKQRIGGIVAKAQRKGGDAAEVINDVYKSFTAAFDDAVEAAGPTTAVGRKLAEANLAFKAEIAENELRKAVGRAIFHVPGGLREFQATRVLDAISPIKATKLSKELDKLIGQKALKPVYEALNELSTVPTMTGGLATGIQSVPFARRALVSGSVGGTLGALTGTDALSGAGASVLMTEALTWSLMNPVGRAIIKAMVKRGAGMDQIINGLAQAQRANLSASTRGEIDAMVEQFMGRRGP